MTKPKIIITGANGLLGREAVKSMAASCDVHALVHSMPSSPIDGVTYQVIDFSSPTWPSEHLPTGVDTIIHLAQSARFREFPDQAMDMFNVNINSTARLLDFAHRSGVKRFIYASSGGVYGTGDQAFHENSPITSHGQLGYYLGSKFCGEVLVQNYASIMNVVVLRFFFMYGPEQRRSMLIPRLVDSVRNGTPITLQGHDGIRLNPIHVRDAARALHGMLSVTENVTLNIGGPDVYTLREVAEMAAGYVGKDPVFEIQETDPKHLIGNIDSLRKLKLEPSTTLVDGMKELL